MIVEVLPHFSAAGSHSSNHHKVAPPDGRTHVRSDVHTQASTVPSTSSSRRTVRRDDASPGLILRGSPHACFSPEPSIMARASLIALAAIAAVVVLGASVVTAADAAQDIDLDTTVPNVDASAGIPTSAGASADEELEVEVREAGGLFSQHGVRM